jgi:hypothetical protein
MDEQRLSLEAIMDIVKTSMARYANGLCQQYQLHPAIMIQILQEIVHENKLTMLNQAIMQMQAKNAPTVEMDLTPQDMNPQDLSNEQE